LLPGPLRVAAGLVLGGEPVPGPGQPLPPLGPAGQRPRRRLARCVAVTGIPGGVGRGRLGQQLLDLRELPVRLLRGIAEPVDRLLPELAGRRVLRRMDGPLDDTVPAARAITTRDLLTFTFGFGMVGEMFASAQPWPVVAAAGELRLATIGPPDQG